jgi:hypothetical protein
MLIYLLITHLAHSSTIPAAMGARIPLRIPEALRRVILLQQISNLVKKYFQVSVPISTKEFLSVKNAITNDSGNESDICRFERIITTTLFDHLDEFNAETILGSILQPNSNNLLPAFQKSFQIFRDLLTKLVELLDLYNIQTINSSFVETCQKFNELLQKFPVNLGKFQRNIDLVDSPNICLDRNLKKRKRSSEINSKSRIKLMKLGTNREPKKRKQRDNQETETAVIERNQTKKRKKLRSN